MAKFIKSLKYVYHEKLNDQERYYVDLSIYKFINFLLFVWDHKYLRYALAIIIFLVILNIVISIIYYFAVGIDVFLQITGIKNQIHNIISFINIKFNIYLNILANEIYQLTI